MKLNNLGFYFSFGLILVMMTEGVTKPKIEKETAKKVIVPPKPPPAPEFSVPESWKENVSSEGNAATAGPILKKPSIFTEQRSSGGKPLLYRPRPIPRPRPKPLSWPRPRPRPRPRPFPRMPRPRPRPKSPASKPPVGIAVITIRAFKNGNLKALKQFHRLADTNRDGKISGFEMLKFTRDNFGKYLNMLKVGRAFQSADANRNGKLSLTEMTVAVRRQLKINNKKKPPVTKSDDKIKKLKKPKYKWLNPKILLRRRKLTKPE